MTFSSRDGVGLSVGATKLVAVVPDRTAAPSPTLPGLTWVPAPPGVEGGSG